MVVVPKVGPVQKFSQLRFYSDEDHWNGRTYKRFRIVIQDSTYIEHCIIRETLFITSSPPHFRCFYNNYKNIMFIDIEQAISQ